MNTERHVNHDLVLEIEAGNGDILVRWTGKSTAREPSLFLAPILSDLLGRSSRENKQVILDFRYLEYMNSSTITPIIKILDEARKGESKVRVVYDGQLRWQQLSFSALEVFETTDNRVQITASET